MDDERTDAAILAAAEASPAVFAVLFDRHFETIYRYVERRAGRDVADEVSGDVFRIAYERRSRLTALDGSALPWLYGVATNLVHKHWRSESRRLRALARSGGVSEPHDGGSPEARLDAQAAAPRLLNALAGLSRRDRDVVVLVAWDDLSYDEVAVALGIPVGTVRSRLNRARRALRLELADLDERTPPFGVATGKDAR
jgi:RNA polymerase sigma factor (sigma-70 family)